SSYNTKNGTNLVYTSYPTIDGDLYIPDTTSAANNTCGGYWLSTPEYRNPDTVLYVNSNVSYDYYNDPNKCARPVVALSSDIQVEKIDGVWTVAVPEKTPVPISSVNYSNIGDYIDLGNNIVGTEATTDDWRIFYKDGDGTVYAILADHLPANQVPYLDGLVTNPTEKPYSVWSTNRDILINELKNTTAWNSFANGIGTATGAPTGELLMNSYNAKNGTKLEYTSGLSIGGDLYYSKENYGYWLASPFAEDDNRLMGVSGGTFIACYPSYTSFSARPVVSIPMYRQVEKVNGIWTIKK
ncbi:MAG: hypothetical protein Q4D76_20185, partial [Oscillospiraceae bacterium]|nr:hypothetical protein [Oscillospiraceae bacterium]